MKLFQRSKPCIIKAYRAKFEFSKEMRQYVLQHLVGEWHFTTAYVDPDNPQGFRPLKDFDYSVFDKVTDTSTPEQPTEPEETEPATSTPVEQEPQPEEPSVMLPIIIALAVSAAVIMLALILKKKKG